MKPFLTFLSIDPSLANTGVVWGTVDTQSLKITITAGVLCETEKTKQKQVRASSDLIERCRQIHRFLYHQIQVYKPDFIFAETPSGSQSADGMKNYGIVSMLLATLNPHPIQVTPQEVKIASVGSKTASKDDIILWATTNHPGDFWLYHNKKLVKKNEHIADAIAIAYAAIKTSQFNQALGIR